MRKRLTNFIKYNKFIYSLYALVLNLLMHFLSNIIKQNKKLILFNSFAGRNFDDSPKAIYEFMKNDTRFSDYILIWTFHNPKYYASEDVLSIKTDTLEYFIYTLKARVWITNSSFERGLNYKNKNTLYINTWHGTPIKKMGTDLDKSNKSFKSNNSKETSIDYFNSQSAYETEIFSRAFRIPKSRFLNVGLPRNDILANYTNNDVLRVRKELNIPDNKYIILYCPTFREYERNIKDGGCVLNIPIDFKKWENSLKDKYFVLFRAHYEVVKSNNIVDNNFIKDVSKYPSLNDLIIVSDILLSDYSSVFFDYSITSKTMLYFTYDYDEYAKNRGMYFDIRNYLDGGNNEDEILNILNNIDFEEEKKKTVLFRKTFVNYYGDATKKTVDKIYNELKEGDEDNEKNNYLWYI